MSTNPYDATAQFDSKPTKPTQASLTRKRATWLSRVLTVMGLAVGGFIGIAMAPPPQVDPGLAADEAAAQAFGFAIGYATFPAVICGYIGSRIGRRTVN